jgi:hypothetical protein
MFWNHHFTHANQAKRFRELFTKSRRAPAASHCALRPLITGSDKSYYEDPADSAPLVTNAVS